jgi:hypothetical protein
MTAAIIIIVSVLFVVLLSRQAPMTERFRAYYARSCTGRAWMKRFPAAKKEEIRAFLDIFIDAFDLDPKKKLAFSPDDRVMDIYRTMYPKNSLLDDMECERLVIECERRYGLDILKHCSESATLGDIFYAIQNRA